MNDNKINNINNNDIFELFIQMIERSVSSDYFNELKNFYSKIPNKIIDTTPNKNESSLELDFENLLSQNELDELIFEVTDEVEEIEIEIKSKSAKKLEEFRANLRTSQESDKKTDSVFESYLTTKTEEKEMIVQNEIDNLFDMLLDNTEEEEPQDQIDNNIYSDTIFSSENLKFIFNKN